MPIVFVHGVNVRDQTEWPDIQTFLRRYVTPVVSPGDPDGVPLHFAAWYEHAARFRWNGASRPRSQLRGQGAGDATALATQARLSAEVADLLGDVPHGTATLESGGLIAGGASAPASVGIRLRDLSDDALADVLLAAATDPDGPGTDAAALAIAADDVAHDPDVRARLAAAADPDAELDVLMEALAARYAPADVGLEGMGVPRWVSKLRDRVSEAIQRAGSAPGAALSVVLLEARGPLNELVTRFLGDVFAYLRQQDRPRAISEAVLGVLTQAHREATERDEPLVVLSHSMGGQVVYDLLAHDLAEAAASDPDLADLRVAFWCAAASQVGLFEELKMFRLHDERYRTGTPVPFPDRLDAWWNVWDPNDVLSYTAAGIIDGIDDGSYQSGRSLLTAHSGYYARPSFYRQLACKLETALADR